MHLSFAPNTTSSYNDTDFLYFSGTSYLGINLLPEFHKSLTRSLKKWGTSYGSSRSANIKLDVYQKGEEFLSTFLQTEDAVTVSSGTLASQFAINAIKPLVEKIYYMPKTHPSILPQKSIPVYEDESINNSLINNPPKNICIVADAVAALETSPFSFNFLEKIPPSTTIYLLVDESHSLGVLGENGNGISTLIPSLKNLNLIIVSSLGKAFGINGGVIAGSKAFIDLIKKDSLFIGSAGMSPAFLDTFINAQLIYENQLRKLRENCRYVFDKVHHLPKIRISKKYPVFFFEDETIAEYLLNKNILITSFYYPASTKKINRIVLNANHTKKQLDILTDCLIQFKIS